MNCNCLLVYSKAKEKLKDNLSNLINNFVVNNTLKVIISDTKQEPCTVPIKCSLCSSEGYIGIVTKAFIDLVKESMPNVNIVYVCTRCVLKRITSSFASSPQIESYIKAIVDFMNIGFCVYSECCGLFSDLCYDKSYIESIVKESFKIIALESLLKLFSEPIISGS